MEALQNRLPKEVTQEQMDFIDDLLSELRDIANELDLLDTPPRVPPAVTDALTEVLPRIEDRLGMNSRESEVIREFLNEHE